MIHELWDPDTDTYHVHDRQDVHTVVDVGGNIGGFSLLMCRLYPSATIVTYEPESENYQVLLENLSRMDHHKQVTPHNVAIWAEAGEVSLSAGSNAAYSAHLGSPAHVCDGGQICGAAQCRHTPETVPCVTLNDVLSTLPPVDILKMDAEGAEFVVLPQTDLSQVKFLCLEAHEVYSSAAAVDSLVTKLNETHDMKNGAPEIWYGELR